ncbi:MAG: pyruvate formate-lyase-activating protein [Erysipelotrichaceae bacterium]
MEGRIHSFESFGTVDGPGIRFVVFLQGCPLRCLYCHNPDTWDPSGGKSYRVEEVVKQILKYKNYIKNGGVTVSGGEAMMQMEFVTALFQALKKQGIHTALDTSGACYNAEDAAWMQRYEALLAVCDLVLFDVKHIDQAIHLKLTGKANDNVLAMANDLSKRNKPMWIRHVLVPGFDEEHHLFALRKQIANWTNVEKVEVLPYHRMGEAKYEQMKLPYRLQGVEEPSKAAVERAKAILKGELDDSNTVPHQ